MCITPRQAGKLVITLVRCCTSWVLATALFASGTAAAITLPQPPANAPNIVIVLLDDVGFGATSTFGGPVETPTLDALAQSGLRFNRFHTTAICSPTRAALLTGRDAHAANVGAVLNSASTLPGYQGVLRPETATIAEILREQGYSTGAFGKWHLTPTWESSPIGPFDRWPTGVGFDTFYGFLGGETDQYEPTLYRGTTAVRRPAGDSYHVTEDIVDEAIGWVDLVQSLSPDKPFFVYLAPGATHAPLQVPAPWIRRYEGHFSAGWNQMRETILERQKALGIVPADTALTPAPEALPAWDSLTPEQKQVAERLMETYAGFLEHTDAQVGRLTSALRQRGQLDNTLFIYIAGDNGSSAEGGLEGSINYMGALQGMPETLEQQLAALDRIGDETTYPQYPAGWGWALTSPFQWVKQVASHLGGTRVGAVVSWPRVMGEQAGGLRSQFTHVNDVVPTILDALAIGAPETVRGVAQRPMDGSSFLASLSQDDAPEHHPTQLFEVNGNRAIYHEGWMASAFHQRLPWSVGLPGAPSAMEDDRWELYNLEEDFSQARNLADSRPEKLTELQAEFQREAGRLGILPLRSAMDTMNSHPLPSLRGERREFSYGPEAVGIPETQGPPLFNRSWSLEATLTGPEPRGVIVTMGGTVAGWSLYLDNQSRPVFRYRSFEQGEITLQGDEAVSGDVQLALNFAYDGGGYAKGGEFTLIVDGKPVEAARIAATPPSFFSIDETFDVGVDTGSPAGTYPADSPVGYPLAGASLRRVNILTAPPR